jgi:hypothetical protein
MLSAKAVINSGIPLQLLKIRSLLPSGRQTSFTEPNAVVMSNCVESDSFKGFNLYTIPSRSEQQLRATLPRRVVITILELQLLSGNTCLIIPQTEASRKSSIKMKYLSRTLGKSYVNYHQIVVILDRGSKYFIEITALDQCSF